MGSAWVETLSDPKRYRVRYRLTRKGPIFYAGKFHRKDEAVKRRDWIRGEFAAMRIPDIRGDGRTLAELAPEFVRSRLDVGTGTLATYETNLGRILDHPIARQAPATVRPADVSAWVADLWQDGEGLARESIRKTKSTLAMLLDFADVDPNPARHRSVKLPKDSSDELMPPIAAHVVAALRLLPKQYRLVHLLLDVSGLRIGELEQMCWKDVDEIDGRLRVRKAVAKTGQSRWVPFDKFPDAGALLVFDAVMALAPREDRDGEAQVFAGFKGSAYRTALAKACVKATIPTFSPHDLRHRRATLWALNAAIARPDAAAWLGHSEEESKRTYTHVALSDRSEVDHLALLKEYGLAVHQGAVA